MSTVLVTGATDGLGRALATRLASEGATVLAHARSEERGRDGPRRAARRSRRRAARRRRPRVAERRARAGRPGARPPRRARQQRRHRLRRRTAQESDDGYELRFAVNYLAGFLLASLLRDRLAASAPARIVNVASAGQQAIDFDDVMLERRLRRRARLPPEQARADHARLRPGRGARGQRRHRHRAAPRDLHGRPRWSPTPA